MHAVVLDRNKTYYAKIGDLVKFDFLGNFKGNIFKTSNVLFCFDGKNVFIGTPILGFVNVVFEVVKHIKDKKVITLKFKRRKHYMKKIGHRQKYTLLKVLSIDIKGENNGS